MIVAKTIEELDVLLDSARVNGKRIGFVPTMGALHKGHISLVEKSVAENDLTVVSVFVNPTQFNDKKDLDTYPRTLEADNKLLKAAGCDYVFTPSEQEMYPEPDTRVFEFGYLGEIMEGAHRPGHFNGVAQIVSKLFYIVKPDRAYFGEKDFQQIAIIRSMVEQLEMPVEIVSCPIYREEDGLALSSRNMRLSKQERQIAPNIYAFLNESCKLVPEKTVQEVTDYVIDGLNEIDGLEVEYYMIIDSETLCPLKSWSETKKAVGCITVYCGDVRLIDNISYLLDE